MAKFETSPYINYSRVTEIEVTLHLSEEEIETARSLHGKEYQKFIKERAHVRISDSDIGWEAPPIDKWDREEEEVLGTSVCVSCGERHIDEFIYDGGKCLYCIENE